MSKIGYLAKETGYMIWKYKLFILIPLFAVLLLGAVMIYYSGPAVVVSFIYAGV